MNLGRILVVLALVLGLSGYVYFYELPAAEKESQKDKLLTADKDAVTGIDLIFPDREIELAKGDAGWRLVRPVDAPADEVTVKAVIAAVVDAQVQKQLDEVPADLAPFGLAAPEPTVKLKLAKGDAPAIAVGAATKIGGNAYVRRGDEPKILLTNAGIRAALNKQAKDLRDKQVLAVFKDDDVTRIDIAAADGQTTTLTKKDKDAWTVDPGGFAADINEVRAYLSTLRSTRAVEFPEDADAAKSGLDTPRLRVTLTTADGTTQTLRLGNDLPEGTQKQLYAQREGQPTIVTLGDFALRSLGKDAKALRDKTPLAFDTARVGRIALTRKDGTGVTFVRAKDGAWNVEGQDAAKSKTTTIDRFLDDVHDLRGADIAAEPAIDLTPFGLDAPDLRISLTDKDGQAIGTVLAVKKDAKYFALREGTQTAYEVRDYMFTRLDKKPGDFINDGSTPPAAAPVPGDGGPGPGDMGDDDGGEEAPGGE